MSRSSVLSIYRRLLKSVDKHITAVTGNVLWRDYVRSEFRLDEQTDDIHAKLQDAADYIYMLESVHESKDLLHSYNISTDKEGQQRDQVRKTAGLVGLRLPDEEVKQQHKAHEVNGAVF